MLLILVSNAIKFSPDGGIVEVACKLIKSVEDLTVQDRNLIKNVKQRSGSQFLEVSVSDTGIGIKKQDMPNLFKLFGFLDASKEINSKGIGLGLHISKKIVKMFNGSITCRSKEGEGTNFIFLMELRENQSNKQISNRFLNPNMRIYPKI